MQRPNDHLWLLLGHAGMTEYAHAGHTSPT